MIAIEQLTRESISQPDGPVLEVRNLKQSFPIKAGLMQHVVGYVKAVDGISFTVERGRTLGLVGESGCGKTTTGKTILRLNDKTSGDVLFNGIDVFSLDHRALTAFRLMMPFIFQDSYASFSPRCPVS